MLFWTLAIAVTAIACAALYYASGRRTVNADELDPSAAQDSHFRTQLKDIEEAVASARLSEPEAVAARGELARELIRQEAGVAAPVNTRPALLGVAMPLSLLAVAVVAIGIYSVMGNPQLPSQPLLARVEAATPPTTLPGLDIDLSTAIADIEGRLAQNPDDLEGWRVIAPVYMQMGRFADAASAYRRINDLQPPSADSEADLAEALILNENGAVNAEAQSLLESAASRDPAHTRSRFYLAAAATNRQDFPTAITRWEELLALANGDEPWFATANSGLAVAQQGLTGVLPEPAEPAGLAPAEAQMVRDMVAGLSARLDANGGSLPEWTQLVRSYLVLGETDAAQAAYDRAKAAYPDMTERAEIDTLALTSGLN